ncbi:hypothetical protein PPL_07928 [Heterostelium album PN500]|uniref:FAD dependent oxidoreductase domain-containing protein n=1 Tax=Heterostelium pallidum (strain ATCC 26659 / Pp 5 / PN500) TaxID=670386 RepID=D3BHC6_HETP5|nr:hypothetical protein PPL_07928 [Heterostelium album PN500]EFA79103.1 hypothetical protein PPL_07928 [Heterostelium album PN500]|eukprot:XP_020431225.1 hypothetical protein PPL_07928 [Heterostelium album PN500]
MNSFFYSAFERLYYPYIIYAMNTGSIFRRLRSLKSHIGASQEEGKVDRSHQKAVKHEDEEEEDDKFYDVIVVGGGITGSSSAYMLAKSGLKVLLLEQYDMCHTNASSHGDGRIIRYSYPEDIYIKLSKLAYPLWAQAEKESQEKLIHITGGIDFGGYQEEALKQLLIAYDNNKINYSILNYKEANKRFPQFKFQKETLVVYQPDSGVVFASKAVSTMWKLARKYGATTLANKRVDTITVDSESLVTVKTFDHSTYQAKKIVLACGGWINDVLLRSQLEVRVPVNVTQEKVFYFAPKPTTPPTIDHSMHSCPVSIYYAGESIFYTLPQIEVRGVKVGLHRSGPILESMDGAKKPYPEEHTKAVREFVHHYMPSLESEQEISSLTCHYTSALDFNFIIDRHPAHRNLIIVSPCSGHGFKFGPAIGQLVLDLAMDIEPPIPMEEFSLSRFKHKLYKRIGA